MHRISLKTLFFLPFCGLLAQAPVEFENQPATQISNDQIAITILNRGGAFVDLTRKDDPSHFSPLWNPARRSRELGKAGTFGSSTGHFVCVDGFGPTSKEEAAAGFEGHGEAHRQPWKQTDAGRSGKVQHVEWRTHLPVMQEEFTRKVELVDGEPVVYVESTLENDLGFDRPVNWAEHATIGYPFLAPGQTVVDASTGRCQTRPHNNQPRNRTLKGGEEFTYPNAPMSAGGLRDVRNVPDHPDSMDHTTCVVAPGERLGWVTAINLEKHMVFGYLFRRAEYPWLQEWMNYPSDLNLARGLEFGTQPYDVSHRQAIDTGHMFDVPTYRWLPAKSKISSRFLMFYARAPEGFTKVDDVRQQDGHLILTDRKAKLTVTLPASLQL